MGVFESEAEFYKCIGGLLERVKHDPALYKSIADSGMVARFRYLEPDAVVTIDARKGVNEILFGDSETPADIEMSMKADVAHRFWMGKVNVIAEVMAGRVSYRGPLSKLTRLLPLLKPAIRLYPDHLRSIGYERLLM
ncbi:sterol carrier protein [Candidatus Poribacteria bacterium]|nr:sterol carrier protein [Candidatus Poribacteria bacterium]